MNFETYFHNKHLIHDGKVHEAMENLACILRELSDELKSTNSELNHVTIKFDGLTWFWSGSKWCLKNYSAEEEEFTQNLLDPTHRRVNGWPRANWVQD